MHKVNCICIISAHHHTDIKSKEKNADRLHDDDRREQENNQNTSDFSERMYVATRMILKMLIFIYNYIFFYF